MWVDDATETTGPKVKFPQNKSLNKVRRKGFNNNIRTYLYSMCPTKWCKACTQSVPLSWYRCNMYSGYAIPHNTYSARTFAAGSVRKVQPGPILWWKFLNQDAQRDFQNLESDIGFSTHVLNMTALCFCRLTYKQSHKNQKKFLDYIESLTFTFLCIFWWKFSGIQSSYQV